MANIPLSVAVPQIYVPSLSVPKINVPHINVPHINVPGAGQHKETILKNKHIVGLADLFSTEEVQDTLFDNGLSNLAYVPILNSIVAAGLTVKERAIDPLLKGNVGGFLINTLETVGDTLDTVANPVKSLMPWAGGGTPTDFMKSVGGIPGEYRQTYQWDTGNFLVDLVGEVVSDPLNWVSLGLKQVGKTSADAVTDLLQKGVKNLYGEDVARTITRQGYRRILEEASKDMTQFDSKIVKQLFSKLSDNRRALQNELLQLNNTNPSYKRIKDMVAQLNKTTRIDANFQLLDMVADLRLTDGFRKYDAVRSLMKSQNTLENSLLAAGVSISNPFLLALYYEAKKQNISDHFKTLWNSAVKKLKTITFERAFNNTSRDLKQLDLYLALKNKSINKKIFDEASPLLKKYKLDVRKLQRLYINIMNDMPPSKLNPREVNQLFMKKLYTYIPELKGYYSPIYKEKFIQELVSAVSDGAIPMYYVEQVSLQGFKNYVEEDMSKYWYTPKTQNLKEFTPLEHLRYLDRRLIPSIAEGKSLTDLPTVLKELSASKPTLYVNLTGLLDYVGINLDNYKQVVTMLKKINNGQSEVLTRLQALLKRSRTGAMLQLDEVKSAKINVTKILNEDLPKIKLDYATYISEEDPILKFFNKAVVDSDKKLYETIYNSIQEDTASLIKLFQDTQKDISEILKPAGVFRILDNDVDRLDLFYEALDDVAGYDGSGVTFAEIFDNVLKFNLNDLDSESIKTLIENIQKLKKDVKMLTQRAKNGQIDLPTQYLNTLRDLDEYLSDKKFTTLINNYMDLFETTNDFYRLMVSHQGMFNITMLHVKELIGNDWWDELSNRSGDVRTTLKKVSASLRRQRASLNQDLSRTLDKLLATIDSSNNLLILTNSGKDLTSYKLKQNQINFLNGMLFNIIYENRFEYPETFINNTEPLVERYMSEFLSHNKDDLIKTLESEIDKRIKTFNTLELIRSKENLTLEEFLFYNDNKDKYDMLKDFITYDRTNQLDMLYTDCINEITSNSREAINKYVAIQSELQREVDDELKLFKVLSNDDVAAMNELGLNYDAIIEALVQDQKQTKKYNIQDLTTVTDFITHIAGKKLEPELDNAKTIIKEMLDSMNLEDFKIHSNKTRTVKKLQQDYNKQIVNKLADLAENSLARAITDAFTEIGMLNSYYGGDKSVIGKLKNKYGGITKLKNVIGYVTVDDFNRFVREVSSYTNSYGWSTANGFLAVKKDFDPYFALVHQINPKMLWGSDALNNLTGGVLNNQLNRDYVLFYNAYVNAYRSAKAYPIINTPAIELMRTALVDVYSKNDVSFGPRNPADYFKRMSELEILSWDAVTFNRSVNRGIAKKYTAIKNSLRKMAEDANQSVIEYQTKSKKSIAEQIAFYKNPAGFYSELETLRANNPMLSEEAWNKYIDNVVGNQTDILLDGIREDLQSYIKDPDSLQIYKRDFENFIRNDIKALQYTEYFGDMMNDDRLVSDFIPSRNKAQWQILRSYGITPDTKLGEDRVMKFLRTERAESLAYTIRSLNAKQLRTFIDTNTPGLFFYINRKPDFEFKFTNEELKEAGIKIDTIANKDGVTYYLIQRTKKEIQNYEQFKYLKLRSFFNEVQDRVTDVFKNNRGYFDWNGIDLPDELFTGDLIDRGDFELLLSDARIQKLLGQNPSHISTDLMSNNFFTKKNARPNLITIGSTSAYNDMLDLISDTLKARNIDPTYMSSRLDKSAWRGSIEAIKRVNAEHKYLQLFFNDDFTLDNPMFRRVFENATDKDIENIFKRNNFDACILREDKHGNPKVYKIHIHTRQQFMDAVKAKAIMVPHDIYRNMVLSINQHYINNKLLQIYLRTIVPTFKTIYLSSVGFLMRNALDTLMYKNLASTDGTAGFIDNFKYEYRAARMIEQHNEVIKKVLELSKRERGIATIDRNYLLRVLSTLPEEERVAFRLTDMFMNSAASSGLADALQDFLLEFNLKEAVTDEYAWETWLKNRIVSNPYVTSIQNINDKIEKIGRYGMFLNLIENGSSLAETVRRITDTHFDYKLKTDSLSMMEQIFWFSTFPINNMFYYINDGLTRNPDMLRLQMDAMQLSWDDETYTWDDVRNQDYLRYNAVTGNIRFELFGKQIVLKTGSSVLDFFNIISDPVGAAQERLNPFLSVITGQDGLEVLNPLNTLVQRGETIAAGRSYIPSVYSKLYPKQEYTKRHYIAREPFVRRSWSYAKKPRVYFKKPDNMKRMKSKFMTYRYYFNRGKNLHRWINATTSIEPHWYMNNYRHYTHGRYFKHKAQMGVRP